MRILVGPRSARDRHILEVRARALRASLTPSEERLWQTIRGRRLGAQFRRQVLIGRYIVDFVAPAAQLVVEVDGRFHESRRRTDEHRDGALVNAGYRVLRLDAQLVLTETEAAVERIRQALSQR